MNVFLDLLRTSANKITSVFVFKLLTVTVLITQIFKVYLKALLNIPPTSPEALYFDLIIFVLLLFTTCTMFLNFKNIITNKIDIIFLVFLLFGIFEIFWTYCRTENLFASIFRYRLWFFPYLLYFSYRYFLKERVIADILKTVKLIMLISFLWSIGEFFLTTFGVVSPKTITAFLSKAIWNPQLYTYGSFPEAYLIRGYGVMADIHFSGVFNVIGLTIFLPEMLDRWNIKDRLFVLLGVSGVIYSLSKTSLALLFSVLLVMFFCHKDKRKLLVMLLIFVVMEIYSLSIIMSITTTPEGSTLYVNSIKEAVRGREGFLSSAYSILKHYFEFLQDSTFAEMLFGHGYYITSHEAEWFNINVNPYSYGEYIHLTFVSMIRQFGIIGLSLFVLVFVIIPLKIYFKDKNLLVKGIALSVAIAGVSTLNFEAIFRSGVNVLVCFLLASLSVLHYELHNREKESNKHA